MISFSPNGDTQKGYTALGYFCFCKKIKDIFIFDMILSRQALKTRPRANFSAE
jgi:hypothetical protein